MYCTSCGSEMNDNQAVCLKCGVNKNVGKSYCASCGSSVSAEAAICTNCGVKLKGGNGNLNGQDKVVMAILCFFLGALGIHNFIMGEIKKGVVRIVVTIVTAGTLGWILPLIDFIKILMDNYNADPSAFI